MGDTKIEWTEKVWNPVRGCSIVSKGCTNCYAMRQAHRSSGPGGAYEGLTKLTKGGPVWTGEIRAVPELLYQPGRWRKPRRIFVNSMSDLFHEDVHDDFIAAVWHRMAWNQQHVFQILTKRPKRMRDWLLEHGPDAVHYGEEVEYQAQLRKHGWPLRNVWLERIDWVVVGGESGPGARPMHPGWARDLRDQCAALEVPFFFKQWGAWAPINYVDQETGHRLVKLTFTDREKVIGGPAEGTEPRNVKRVGKKLAGRELDGRTHDEYPRDCRGAHP